MSQSQAALNRIWSEVLLEELTRFGVEHICIAPGSRSTPLTLEADANPKLQIHTHFDERGLGFYALGLAKATKKPVAIVVTSGTAVANLLPAIAEANLTGEKLVVLTADRPIELVGCGANQAINQNGIYSSHVTTALNLPSPSTSIALNWLLTSVDQVMHQQKTEQGPIHINCPFPEPLYGGDKAQFKGYSESISSWQNSTAPYTQRVESSFMSCTDSAEYSRCWPRKGLIVVGSVSLIEANKAKQFAEQLGWPIFCDPQSGASSAYKHYDLWLQNVEQKAKLSPCEVIVQFGSRIVSKRLNQWLNEQVAQRNAEYIYVDPQRDRNNQTHLPQRHIVTDIALWIDGQLAALDEVAHEPSRWLDAQDSHRNQIFEAIEVFVRESANQSGQNADQKSGDDEPATELNVAHQMDRLPKQADVFIGNSLFVRLVDMVGSADGYNVFSNRGASGIDGLIATSAGLTAGRQKPSVTFIGDTSLLYDLNSLALFSRRKIPSVIVVTNNDGGAIFDLLPVPTEQKSALYQMPHGFGFEHAAKQFNLVYESVQTMSQYHQCIAQHLEQGEGTLLIEIVTPPDQASEQVKKLSQLIHAL